MTNSPEISVKKRGRPKGAKNKPKNKINTHECILVKKRGRPKGSKNKPRVVGPSIKSKPILTKADKNPPVKQLDDYALLQLVSQWLEKNMHPNEVQYYRSRATKLGYSTQQAVMADILGFFNIQNPELNKQIKKNNFIATTKNELNAKN